MAPNYQKLFVQFLANGDHKMRILSIQSCLLTINCFSLKLFVFQGPKGLDISGDSPYS